MADHRALIGPRSPELARKLLELAEELGIDPVDVRAKKDGYDVPAALKEAHEGGAYKNVEGDVVGVLVNEEPKPVKRGPGRPRKDEAPAEQAPAPEETPVKDEAPEEAPKRRRGRPPKIKEPEPVEAPEKVVTEESADEKNGDEDAGSDG